MNYLGGFVLDVICLFFLKGERSFEKNDNKAKIFLDESILESMSGINNTLEKKFELFEVIKVNNLYEIGVIFENGYNSLNRNINNAILFYNEAFLKQNSKAAFRLSEFYRE